MKTFFLTAAVLIGGIFFFPFFAQGADLLLSPSIFDYGNVRINTTASKTFELINTSQTPKSGIITLSNPVFTCIPSCSYNLSSPLSGGDRTNITIQFKPTSVSPPSFSVLVRDNPLSSPSPVIIGNLSGTGVSTPSSACDPTQGQICNPLEAQDLQGLIDTLLNFIFKASLVVVPFIIIVAGFTMVTADGNMKQVTKGRDILLWAVIGFAIILISKGLSTILLDILKGS